jgi:triacylglycerol lipase
MGRGCDERPPCVFTLNYGSYNGSGAFGVYATGKIETSAQQLATFVDRVLAATQASQVDWSVTRRAA